MLYNMSVLTSQVSQLIQRCNVKVSSKDTNLIPNNGCLPHSIIIRLHLPHSNGGLGFSVFSVAVSVLVSTYA